MNQLNDLAVVRDIAGQPTTLDSFEIVRAHAEIAGAGRVAFARIRSPGAADGSSIEQLMTSYPGDWKQSYFESEAWSIDPVIRAAYVSRAPFLWSEIRKRWRLTRRQCSLMRSAEDAGLRTGLTVPMREPDGTLYLTSFAAESRDGFTPELTRLVHLLASQLRIRVSQDTGGALGDAPALLSRKEVECLKWVSRGKSSWDISVIVGVSEDAVNFRLRNIFRKLGTNSRTVAVLKAFSYGYIEMER